MLKIHCNNKTKVNKEYKNKNEIMQNMSPII